MTSRVCRAFLLLGAIGFLFPKVAAAQTCVNDLGPLSGAGEDQVFKIYVIDQVAFQNQDQIDSQAAHVAAARLMAEDWEGCAEGGLRLQEGGGTPDVTIKIYGFEDPEGEGACARETDGEIKVYIAHGDPDDCIGGEKNSIGEEWGHFLGLGHVSGCGDCLMEDPSDGTLETPCGAECNWAKETYSTEPDPEGPISPLVLNLDGDEIETSNVDRNPVRFDLDGDGVMDQVGWLVAESRDAFLWLDLNNNGSVDGGRELFGNHTLLPDGTKAEHGFEALAAHDSNGDNKITSADAVWARLALWNDWNHDGFTQASEVTRLPEANVVGISLRSNERRWVDDAGNSHYRVGVFWTGGPQNRGRIEDVWFQIR